MVKLSTLAAAGLLFSGCQLGVAGPDDEQVLVQRATFVQQEKDLELEHEVSKSRRDFAGKVRGATEKLKTELVRRQSEQVVIKRRQGNNTFGKEGEICSFEDMKSYDDAVKAYVKKQTNSGIKFVEHLSNYTSSALETMLHPLIAGAKALVSDEMDKIKTPMLNIMKYHILKAMKPAKRYNEADMVPMPDASAKEIERIMLSNTKQWQATITKSWQELDVLLNKAAKDLPVVTDLHLAMEASPWIEWVRNKTNLAEYLAFKAMPIIAMEVFPKIVEPLQLFARFPTKKEDMFPYLVAKVYPTMRAYAKTSMEEGNRFFPGASDYPIRKCTTCNEKYVNEVTQFGVNMCMEHCFNVVNQCAMVIDKICMETSWSCLQCHTDKMADLDACEGVGTHMKPLQKLRNITYALKYAGDEEGFDMFLHNISTMIVDHD